ncbi:MAG: histidine phosphatase family protein [Balneolaceae bacterium]
MKQLFIIRHGETDNNKAHIMQGRSLDASINELGKMQAQAICEAMEPYQIDKIVASGLVRTYETVEPLAQHRKLKIEKYPELDEIDFGDLEGKVFTEIQDQIEHLVEQWESGNVDCAPKNGESPREAFRRANAKAKELLESSDEESIVFMIHGRLTRILLSEWLGYGLKNMHKIEHQNGAINHLTWHDGKFKAVELNKTDHLLELV